MDGVTEEYRGPLTRGTLAELIVLQMIVWVLFGLFLDYGVLSRACGFCLTGYWIGVAMIFWRRGGRLTLGDRLFVDVGWIVILGIGMCVALWYWRSVGAIG